MAWDTIAYYEDRTGTTTYTPVAGLADDIHTVSADDITVPFGYQQVISSFATLSNATDLITGFQLSSPSLRATSLLDNSVLHVIAAGSVYTAAFPRAVNWYSGVTGMQAPRVLAAGEKLNCLVESSAATANDLISSVVLLGNGNYSNPLAGQAVETVEFNIPDAAVANTWTSSQMSVATGSSTLRTGRYAIVGAEAYQTTGKCMRFIFKEDNSIFPGQGVARPGIYQVNRAVAGYGPRETRMGNMGLLGTFTTEALPSSESFCLTTDTAATTHIYLDLVKIA